ncbi:MAG: acyl--CoA ligase [Oscillospiraceae bacterium]|nr:acyl--CoA ligase [Oscillospiraceae bacterium]
MSQLPSQQKPWQKYYSPEALQQLLPKCSVLAFAKESNKNNLDSTALDYYGKNISYREFFHRIDEAANAFAALGVKKGDLVCFVTVGVPETICAIYALNKLGATANMIDPRMDVTSIRKMIKNSGACITLVIDVAFPKIRKIIDEINQKKIVIQSPVRSLPLFKKIAMTLTTKTDIPYSDVVVKWDQFLSYGKGTIAQEAPYEGDATVAITFTGGTTGFPKGVMLTNDSMNAVAINFQHAGLDAHPGESFLGIIPVFTSYGMVCGMHMPLCMQLKLTPIPKFVPDQFGKLVRQFRPNHMISTPAFYELMMDSKEMENFDLSFLITMGSGGDTMNEGLETKLNDFMKTHNIRYPLAQGYGMSEVSAAASFSVNDIFKSKSVGIPSVTTTIAIFDPDTGEELGYNELGEICITGPSMMKGYYRKPDETAHVMRRHSDGLTWVHSGDIGYMDEDGFVFIKGRLKRMITRFDGHKVFPVGIESMVSQRSEVHNCCVIGVNDLGHGQGQYPLVIVELDGGVDRDAACRKIFAECMAQLEERGKPVAVLAVDKIPLTGSGKNDYRALELEYGTYEYTKWDPASV